MDGAAAGMSFSSIDLQCNWDEVPRKFWVSCRRPGVNTLHGSLSKTPSGLKGDDSFIIRDHNSCSVTVECPEAKLTTRFVCPRKVLHLNDRKLLAGDVLASGGLGVCSSESGQLWVWDTDTGTTRRSLEGHVGDVYSCRFFPSGVVVLSGGADRQLKIWSTLDGSCPRTLVGHSQGITATSIIDRGKNVVSVSSDGTAKLWDCGSGSCLATLSSLQCSINDCALGATDVLPETSLTPPVEPESGTAGNLLLLACEDGVLRGCDVRNKDNVLTCRIGDVGLSSCVLINETEALVGSEGGVLATIDLRNPREPVQSMMFGNSSITSLSLLSGNKVISGMGDGNCVVWGMDDAQVALTKLTDPNVDPITSIRVCAGQIFTTCRDGCIRVYDCADVS